MRNSIWFSREEVYLTIANLLFNAGYRRIHDSSHRAGECGESQLAFRYLPPGRWLNEALYRFFFRLRSLQWNSYPPNTAQKPVYCKDKVLLASLNQFIFSSIDERYAFPLLLHIEGYHFLKIADVLEISLAQVLLRIQKGKNMLYKEGVAWEKILAS